MIDFTSLVYALVAGFGLFSFDAVWNASTVHTDFTVAQSVADSGISSDFAETAFTREIQEVFSTESLIKSPEVRSSHDKTFVSILAEAAGLENATAAFQDLFGIQPVALIVTLVADDSQLKLEVVGEAEHQRSFYLSLPGNPGELPVDLIRRGAVECALRLDVYHTALHLLDPDSGDPDILRASAALDAAIAAQPPTPRNPHRARLRNLRGIAALLDNDKAAAGAQFEAAIADDPTLVPAILNLAFLRVEQDRYDEALEITRALLQAPKLLLGRDMQATAHTISGVALWALRDTRAAEEQFAAAVAAQPKVSDAYIYWGQMLNELDRRREARDRIRQGEDNLADFENYPEVALLYFWLTDKNDMPLQRRPRGAPI